MKLLVLQPLMIILNNKKHIRQYITTEVSKIEFHRIQEKQHVDLQQKISDSFLKIDHLLRHSGAIKEIFINGDERLTTSTQL